jgi:hypothetical protein
MTSTQNQAPDLAYTWRAYNYKTKAESMGFEDTRDAACAKAEAAKLELGFRDTVASVTDFMGRRSDYRPHERVSARMIWTKPI